MFSGTVPDYLCIYVFILFPEMLCFQALCQIICVFMYLYYFQKCYVFRHCARLFVYLCIYIISRNVMFSGTVPDYLCIYVFILFPEMLCFLALCQIICLFMYLYYFQNQFCLCFQALCTWQDMFQNHCIMIPSIRWTQLYCSCEYTIIQCMQYMQLFLQSVLIVGVMEMATLHETVSLL